MLENEAKHTDLILLSPTTTPTTSTTPTTILMLLLLAKAVAAKSTAEPGHSIFSAENPVQPRIQSICMRTAKTQISLCGYAADMNLRYVHM